MDDLLTWWDVLKVAILLSWWEFLKWEGPKK